MSYKVIKPFYDKTDNRKPYSKGDSYTSDDEKRIAFLIDQGFLAAPKITKGTKTTKRTKAKKKKKASE